MRTLLALMPCVLIAPAYAQDDTTKKDEASGDEMVITASRSNIQQQKAPQVVTVITKEQIEQQMQVTSDSSQILSNLLPSFSPSRQKMSGSGETFRGRAALVMIDGIPQSNPLRPTGREMHTIDYSMVERIEVIHGANATNGMGAIGGVINIITRRPENGSFNQHVNVQTTIPTEKIRGETASYKTTYRVDGREDYLDYLFAIGYENQGLYLDGNNRPVGVDNTQGDTMDSRSYDLLAKVGYWLDDYQRIQLSVNRYHIKGENNYLSVDGIRAQGIPTTSVRGTPPGEAPNNSIWTTGLTYEHHDLAGMKLSALVFNQRYEALFGATQSSSFQDPALAPVGSFYDQSQSVANKYGTKLALTKDDLLDDTLKVTVGFDTLYDKGKQDLYLTKRTYVPKMEYTNYSPFIQGEYQLLDDLVLHAGVRHESAKLKVDSFQALAANNGVFVEGGSLTFNETLYNVGAVYSVTNSLDVFASYSEGFGMPEVGRVLRDVKAPNVKLSNFNNLKPIVTDNVETGFRFKKDRFDFEASYYQSNSKLGDRVEQQGDTFVSKREKTRIQGIEVTAGYQINERHKVNASYAHSEGKYDSNSDGKLDKKLNGLNIAPDRLITSWSANWNDQWSSFVQANYAFGRSFDDAGLAFDGYLLMDAAVGYKLPYGRLNMAVANLLDKQYITYYSQAGLVNDTRYFSGRGRTVTLGYSIDF
ncbi:TonB-dependent receptor [Pectobacterium carotovorum]|uniref:TonB-dependent receptor n=1 Tax=Pectobacterium carotovorum TaxID=554 RepID=UPI0001A4319A|nr:TonB-dependent receptor [Pectobacterium carotovorum]KHT34890.1 TonB-dependent receptor [Pectobacterium carotovorum subsp. carotovorum]MBA0174755.1 TonB-dependent receptor [Pectobacterium carotovorum]MBL0866529.1 TonB-dependent receptor [Pectobacterium carotovorum]MDK9422207.1 TonB-dependent receptor [Pectobacterium carotovorum]QHP54767.1 TonB-dependent receptor [Pectobacterium carotovorum subsp. carotovorum]